MFEHLGLALRVLRELRGVSQAGLARQAGMGKSQLSKYENGKELPKLDSLEKVLATLGAEPLALFYLEHFLGRLDAEEISGAVLLGTDFGPACVDSEHFTRLIREVFLLFESRMERRVREAREGALEPRERT